MLSDPGHVREVRRERDEDREEATELSAEPNPRRFDGGIAIEKQCQATEAGPEEVGAQP